MARGNGGEFGGGTGRQYGRRREKGWKPWRPTADKEALFEQVLGVFDRYREQLPLTVRQIFYILIGMGLIEKDQGVLNSLNDMLTNARRARRVDWRWLRDSPVGAGED